MAAVRGWLDVLQGSGHRFANFDATLVSFWSTGPLKQAQFDKFAQLALNDPQTTRSRSTFTP
jgi:hypothetical protein